MIKYINNLEVGDEFNFINSPKKYNCKVVSLNSTKSNRFCIQYIFNDKIRSYFLPNDKVEVKPKFNPMTVSDLIALLSTFDPNSIVVQTSSHINGGYTPAPSECFVSDNMEYYNDGNLVVLNDLWQVDYHLEHYSNDNILPAIEF